MSTYQMKVQIMKNSKFNLNSEFSSFKSRTYNTFTSSYLNNCSDSYVNRMFSNLNDLYSKIEKTYNSLLETWEKYIQDLDGIENFLANNSGFGSISTSSIRSILGSMGRYYSTSRSMDNFFKEQTIDTDADIIKLVGTDEYRQVLANAEVAKEKLKKYNEEKNKSWIEKRLDDVGGFFSDGFEAIGQIGDEFGRYFSGENDDWLNELGYGLGKTGEQVAATGAEVGTGIVEGVVSVGETIYDGAIVVGSVALTPFTLIMDASLDNDSPSITSYLWENTNKTVAEDRTAMLFDEVVHKSDYGNWMDENTFGDPNKIRNGSKVVGSIAGNIGLMVATAGLGKAIGITEKSTKMILFTSSAQGFSGFSNGYEDAIREDPTNTAKALGIATLKGIKTYGSAVIGGKINSYVGDLPVIGGKGGSFSKGIADKLQVFNNNTVTGNVTNALTRITLDGMTGAIEDTLIDPAIDALYKNGYVDQNGNYIEFDANDDWETKFYKMYEANGGIEGSSKAFMTNGLISAATEVKGTYNDIKDINTVNKIKNAVSNNKSIDISSYKKIKNISNETINEIDEILNVTNKKDLVKFDIDGKNMSFDELKLNKALDNANLKNVNSSSKKNQTIVTSFENKEMITKDVLEKFDNPENVIFMFKDKTYSNALSMKQNIVLNDIDKNQINSSLLDGNDVKINMKFKKIEEVPDQLFKGIDRTENLYFDIDGKQVNGKELIKNKINKLSKNNIYVTDIFSDRLVVDNNFLKQLDNPESVIFKLADKNIYGDELLEYNLRNKLSSQVLDANEASKYGKMYNFGKFDSVDEIPEDLLKQIDKPLFTSFNINGKHMNATDIIKEKNKFDPMKEYNNAQKQLDIGVKKANYYNSLGLEYNLGEFKNIDDISMKSLKKINGPTNAFIEIDGEKMSIEKAIKKKSRVESAKNYIKDILTTTAHSPALVPAMAAKFIVNPLEKNQELFTKAKNEGLYHICSEDTARIIMNSEYVKSSNLAKSYGYSKSYFFAGVPNIEELCVNGLNPSSKLWAVNFKLSDEELSKFSYRSVSDYALSYKGNYKFDPKNAQIIELGLVKENGKYLYKPLDQIPPGKLISDKEISKNISRSKIAINREYEYIVRDLKDGVNKVKNTNVVEVASNVKNYIVNKIKQGTIAVTFPFSISGRVVNPKITTNEALKQKVATNGLFYITSPEDVGKIMDSKYIKSSTSRSYFYSEIPDVDTYVSHARIPTATAYAIRLKPYENQLDDFSYRSTYDNHISHKGDYHFDGNQAEVIELKLVKINGKYDYKPASEITTNDIIVSQAEVDKVYSSISKRISVTLSKEYEIHDKNFQNLINRAPKLISDNYGGVKLVNEKYTLNIDDSLNNERNVRSTITRGNRKYINELGDMSLAEQKKEIATTTSSEFKDFYVHSTNSDIDKLLQQHLIDNQDYLFSDLSQLDSFYNNSFIKKVSNDADVLSKLSNDNLSCLAVFATDYTLEIPPLVRDEVIKRLNSNEMMFAIKPQSIERIKATGGYATISNQLEIILRSSKNADISELVKKNYLNTHNYKISDALGVDRSSLNLDTTQLFSLAKLYDNNLYDESSKKVLTKILGNNIMVTSVNFSMLDKNIISELGEDFVFNISRYTTLSNKVLALRNNDSNSYNILCQLINNSNIDDSLDLKDIKIKTAIDFLYNNHSIMPNAEDLDLETFQEFLLYLKNTNVDINSSAIDYYRSAKQFEYSNDIFVRNALEVDKLVKYNIDFSSENALSELKEAYFNKYFSISSANVADLYNKYKENIYELVNNCDDKILKEKLINSVNMLEKMNEINNMTDINKLITLYNETNFSFKPSEVLSIDDTLRSGYVESYVKKFSTTNDNIKNSSYKVEQYTDSNGNVYSAKIYEMKDEFGILVHSSDTGFTGSSKELINDSFVDRFNTLANGQTHGISTSYISSSNIGSAAVGGNGVLYGFTNVDDKVIRSMGSQDIKSFITEYGFTSPVKQNFMLPDTLSKNTTRCYNEVVLDRDNIKPDYIVLLSDAPETIKQNSIKSASQWGIDIVEIDVEDLAKNQIGQAETAMKNFRATADINYLKEAIDIYETGASGFNINLVDINESNVYKNVHVVAKDIYDNSNINSTCIEYANYLKQTGDEAAINEYIDIIKGVEARYDATNNKDHVITLIAHTKPMIDTKTILSILS